MSSSDIHELESKIAFMERHIVEQDKVILKLQQMMDILEDRLKKIEDDQEQSGNSNRQASVDERPPHY